MNPELASGMNAFLVRDYERCSHIVGPLLEKGGVSLVGTHLLITCYTRMGLSKDAEEVGLYYISKMTEKWDQRMAALGLGMAKMEEITNEANHDLRKLQLCYYLGSYYVTQHMFKPARDMFERVLLGTLTPVSSEELYLLTVEYSYLTNGESGTDLDKPVVALNSQTAQLFGAGKMAEAEKLAVRAYDTAQKTLGRLHPAYLNSLNNLATLYYTVGKTIEARPLFEEHVKWMKLAAGAEDVSYASALEMLAMALIKGRQMGQPLEFDRAEASLQEALAIRQKAQPANEPDIQRTRDLLANLRQAQDAVKATPPSAPTPEKKPPARWSWSKLFGRKSDETVEQIRESYGFTPEDPILCDNVLGELQFLTSLRCPKGHPIRGSRSGSGDGKCTAPTAHKSIFPGSKPEESCIVDRYEAVCDGGEYTCALFFDMYHPEVADQPAPRGMKRVPA